MLKHIIKCPECEGTGKKPLDHLMGLASAGIYYLFELTDRQKCNICDGAGKI